MVCTEYRREAQCQWGVQEIHDRCNKIISETPDFRFVGEQVLTGASRGNGEENPMNPFQRISFGFFFGCDQQKATRFINSRSVFGI